VLDRKTGRGFEVTISGVGDIGQLHLLLQDELIGDPAKGLLAGERPSALAVAGARDRLAPPPDRAPEVRAAWLLLDHNGRRLDHASAPADIAVLEGRRVIVLEAAERRGRWSSQRMFPWTVPEVDTRSLSDHESAALLARCAPPATDPAADLTLALAMFAVRQYSSGLEHLASALALDPTNMQVSAAVASLVAELGSGAADLVLPEPGRALLPEVAATKAALLRAAGRAEDTVSLLANVIAVEPERPWPTLRRAWLREDPALPLPPRKLGLACAEMIERVKQMAPSDKLTATLSIFTEVLVTVIERHPDEGELLWAASGVARRCGHPDRALEWARRGEELCQTTISASMLGYAYKVAGDEQRAAEAFVLASRRDPASPSPASMSPTASASSTTRPTRPAGLRRRGSSHPTWPRQQHGRASVDGAHLVISNTFPG
jgi:hypothetical protein